MYSYLIKRLWLTIPTLFGAAVLVFVLMRFIPGDVCFDRLGGAGLAVTEAQLELCREELGLNKPLIFQFKDFIFGLLTFDFGKSMWTQNDISYEIGLRFELTLQIAIMAIVTSIIIALPAGIIAAVWQDTWIDYLVRCLSIAGIAIPGFWFGMMIILGLLIATQKLTGDAWMMPIDYVPIWEDPLRNISQTIWPAMAVGYQFAASTARMTRSAMLEVLREDYIRTARAKGLLERTIRNPHALKNALLPVVTIIGLEFSGLVGGLTVTEQVFNLNGLGRLLVDGVLQGDYTLTQAIVILTVVLFVVINLFVDLFYAWIDPRIRYT